MDTKFLRPDEVTLEFHEAKQAADALADATLGVNTCMSWYDRDRDQESPAHAGDCHEDGCEMPGYLEYAVTRGATLQVDVGEGAFVFCYRPLGEFAGEPGDLV